MAVDSVDQLAYNIEILRKNVAEACRIAGRAPQEITVVAASKCVPADVVELLPRFGILHAGENRVQEFTEKYRDGGALRWHMIGALQTNKVKYVIGKVAMIQSVDRISLLEEIDRLSGARGIVTDVLVEVNIGMESNKSGVAPREVQALADAVAMRNNVRLCGLMSVPPIGADENPYAHMHDLHVRVMRDHPEAKVLSMGMSEDYRTAIRYGSTMIRPGRALFGPRTPRPDYTGRMEE